MKKILLAFCFLLTSAFAPITASAVPMTNADVIKMVKADLDQSIIINSIKNSDNGFDTSADGLIALSEAKVPKPIINAIIERGAAKSSSSSSSSSTAANTDDPNVMKPTDVFLVDGSDQKTLRYIVPQSRSAARAMGLGGVATYSVLRGRNAQTRTTNKAPAFIVAVPTQAQPESYLTLANFEIRKNDTREVLTGGGYMSYSSGIHRNRVIDVTAEKLEDQSKAAKDFTIYKITPTKTLAAGEYALVFYTGEMQTLVSGWFGGVGNAYFDFGVE